MTLPIWTTNPYTALTTSQIEDEFGGDAPTGLSEYYRNGSSGYVTGDRVGFPNGVSTPIPLFGSPLSISNFYGASAVSYSITTNKTAYNEGETMSISVTAPAADGSTLYWTIEDVTTGISISPTSLPTGIKGGSQAEVYQQQLTASGGTGPYTFSIVVGSPPAGISLSSAGLLSGFPTSAGVTTFTVQALDSQGNGGVQQYTLSVVNVTYLPATLPNGTQGSAYSQQLSVSGGTGPYVYEMLGTLPAGLTLSSSGLISGTPTTNGTFNTTIRVIFNGGSLGDPGITITYSDWVISTVPTYGASTIGPNPLPTGYCTQSYSQQLTFTGDVVPPVTFVHAATPGQTYSSNGAPYILPLPGGISLSSTGLLSGTIDLNDFGVYNLFVTATDSRQHTVTSLLTWPILRVTNGVGAGKILPESLPAGTQNTAYSQQISVDSINGPFKFASTGSLPAGLSLTPGGLLSGTPTVSGTFSVGIVAGYDNTDNDPANDIDTFTATYSLVINSPVVISISPLASTVLTGTQNVSYSQAFTASGGTPSYTFSAVGQLPPGLTLVGGLLIGTPTSSGSFGFTISAVDANGNSGTATYSLVVAAAPTSSLGVLVGNATTGGFVNVRETDNPPVINIGIFNQYPIGHIFNPGDVDTVSWQISGTGITANDFNSMELYSGDTPANDKVTINPVTSLSGTIDLKYFASGNYMFGTIYIYVKADMVGEGAETFTFTATFNGQTASGSISLLDS